RAFRPGIVPVREHAHALAAGQPEAGDIDRVGCRVLAPIAFAAAVEPSAGIAAEVVDPNHSGPEMAARRGLEDFPLPNGQGCRDGAGDAETGRRETDRARSS